MKQMFVSRWTHPGLIYVLFLKNSTFSIAIYIYSTTVYIIAFTIIFLSQFCHGQVIYKLYVYNNFMFFVVVVFFNACKPSSNLIPVKLMRPCQGKVRQATWPKKERERVK